VDHHGQAAIAEDAHEPLDPGDVVPVAVAEHEDFDLARIVPSRRMFSIIPFGETPVSNSSVCVRPARSTRTSAENPRQAMSASGTPDSGLSERRAPAARTGSSLAIDST
jgi:hypothetical protein